MCKRAQIQNMMGIPKILLTVLLRYSLRAIMFHDRGIAMMSAAVRWSDGSCQLMRSMAAEEKARQVQTI